MKILKRGQDQKIRNFFQLSRKTGQEEMVGFAVIMIIVAIILLIFLSFSLGNKDAETVESYEVTGFIQSFLQYTTDCRDNLEYISIQDLIFDCEDGKKCLDERTACEALNSSLKGILNESWKIEGDRPVKGYKLDIVIDEEGFLLIEEGNITRNSKGSSQDLSRAGKDYSIYFNVYY